MIDETILAQLPLLPDELLPQKKAENKPNLHTYWRQPQALPAFVTASATVMRCLEVLRPLHWAKFPERNLRETRGTPAVPYAPFVAACLIKLDLGLAYMSQLRQYLVEHPALVWLLGFPLIASSRFPWGFEADASLPTHRHFTRMLRTAPNDALQGLLASSVVLLQAELAPEGVRLGESISLDTKHILAWVKENNPKAYVSDRFNKDQQPAGDPDCRLGCKRRHNQRASSKAPPPTPARNPVSADTVSIGEFYWGYASGVVATQVAEWGELVLAEFTQPFDQSDVSYFFPLLHIVEQRLGARPRCGALDAAFDAFYVYEYFHLAGGFAAVPFSERGGYKNRQFAEDGAPLCQAGLRMPLKYRFTDRSSLVEHECGRHVCPLLYPTPTGQACPVTHKHWATGGCVTTLPTSIGARLRYQIDRESDAYRQVYRQRTANERINSQALALGIERPRIRNSQAITNQNTLIYVLINLRALQRIRERRAQRRPSTPSGTTDPQP